MAGGKAYVQGVLSGSLLEQLPDHSNDEAVPRLSSRERQILRLVSEGLVNKQIPRRFDVSEATVEPHIKGTLTAPPIRFDIPFDWKV